MSESPGSFCRMYNLRKIMTLLLVGWAGGKRWCEGWTGWRNDREGGESRLGEEDEDGGVGII